MKPLLVDMLWLDEHSTITLPELSELSGLSLADLGELVDYGVIAPLSRGSGQLTFHAHCVVTAKTAHRLRHDFELDLQAVALAVTLLDRVRELESQLQALEARLPHEVT